MTGALACLLGACGGTSEKKATSTSTASYSTLLGAGTDLLSQGNSAAAEQLFKQAIAKSPGDPGGHYDLGVLYQHADDRRDALREYNQALLANSRYVPALFNEATLYTPYDAPLAIFDYRQVIELQPHSPTAFLNLGLLENQTKSLHRRAVQDLRRAVRLDPSLLGGIPASLRAELTGGSNVRRKAATHSGPSHRG